MQVPCRVCGRLVKVVSSRIDRNPIRNGCPVCNLGQVVNLGGLFGVYASLIDVPDSGVWRRTYLKVCSLFVDTYVIKAVSVLS